MKDKAQNIGLRMVQEFASQKRYQTSSLFLITIRLRWNIWELFAITGHLSN